MTAIEAKTAVGTESESFAAAGHHAVPTHRLEQVRRVDARAAAVVQDPGPVELRVVGEDLPVGGDRGQAGMDQRPGRRPGQVGGREPVDGVRIRVDRYPFGVDEGVEQDLTGGGVDDRDLDELSFGQDGLVEVDVAARVGPLVAREPFAVVVEGDRSTRPAGELAVNRWTHPTLTRRGAAPRQGPRCLMTRGRRSARVTVTLRWATSTRTPCELSFGPVSRARRLPRTMRLLQK